MNNTQATVVGIGLIVLAMIVAGWVVVRSAATRPPPATAGTGPAPDFKFVRVRPGTFLMGAAGDRDDPQHPVTLTKAYDLAANPVTVDQFAAFVAATGHKTRPEVTGVAGVQRPQLGEYVNMARGVTWRTRSAGQPGTCPVACVSWTDAAAYCDWTSEVARRHVRLPTEAEWEYACRAGTTGPFNVDGVPPTDLGWFVDNSGDHPFDALRIARDGGAIALYQRLTAEHCRPHPVGQRQPNAWGLYDMHGNVWQWCADAVGPYTAGPVTDPSGPLGDRPQFRSARGGSFCTTPATGTSYNRGYWQPTVGYYHVGFRVAVDVP